MPFPTLVNIPVVRPVVFEEPFKVNLNCPPPPVAETKILPVAFSQTGVSTLMLIGALLEATFTLMAFDKQLLLSFTTTM